MGILLHFKLSSSYFQHYLHELSEIFYWLLIICLEICIFLFYLYLFYFFILSLAAPVAKIRGSGRIFGAQAPLADRQRNRLLSCYSEIESKF